MNPKNSMTTKPTIKHARKVIDVVSCGLSQGLGVQKPGEMCIEAAVCYAFGLPHGDAPECVGNMVRNTKIKLNDSDWSSKEARAKGMIRIAVAQLGSNTIDQNAFAETLAELTIRRIVPIALRKEAIRFKGTARGKKLIQAADRCQAEGTKDAVIAAEQNCKDGTDALRIACYAKCACDGYAVDVVFAARILADMQKTPAARNKILSLIADLIEEALVKCKSPGCKWLYLLDKPIA